MLLDVLLLLPGGGGPTCRMLFPLSIPYPLTAARATSQPHLASPVEVAWSFLQHPMVAGDLHCFARVIGLLHRRRWWRPWLV